MTPKAPRGQGVKDSSKALVRNSAKLVFQIKSWLVFTAFVCFKLKGSRFCGTTTRGQSLAQAIWKEMKPSIYFPFRQVQSRGCCRGLRSRCDCQLLSLTLLPPKSQCGILKTPFKNKHNLTHRTISLNSLCNHSFLLFFENQGM